MSSDRIARSSSGSQRTMVRRYVSGAKISTELSVFCALERIARLRSSSICRRACSLASRVFLFASLFAVGFALWTAMTRRLPLCCEADAAFLSGTIYEHMEQSIKGVIAKCYRNNLTLFEGI